MIYSSPPAVQKKGYSEIHDVSREESTSCSYGATLQKDPSCVMPSSWTAADPFSFLIRGENYLRDRQKDAHEESKAVTKAAAMKAIKQRMEKDVDEVGKVARFIKAKLEELDRDNLAHRQKPGRGKGTGVDRSRMSTTMSLKKKLRDKMSEFQVGDVKKAIVSRNSGNDVRRNGMHRELMRMPHSQQTDQPHHYRHLLYIVE